MYKSNISTQHTAKENKINHTTTTTSTSHCRLLLFFFPSFLFSCQIVYDVYIFQRQRRVFCFVFALYSDIQKFINKHYYYVFLVVVLLFISPSYRSLQFFSHANACKQYTLIHLHPNYYLTDLSFENKWVTPFIASSSSSSFFFYFVAIIIIAFFTSKQENCCVLVAADFLFSFLFAYEFV